MAAGSGTPSLPSPPDLDPADEVPVVTTLGAIEALLRQPGRLLHQLSRPRSEILILSLLLVAILCSGVYGLVVGTFSGGIQLWAAPLKIALGLLLSALICLPSLYIFSCLSGSRARMVEVCGMVAGLLALMTILLVGFAPVAWVFSQSMESLPAMGSLHLAFWMVSVYFGLRELEPRGIRCQFVVAL